MRYNVRQKILSFTDNYVIKDENNNPCFKVNGSFFTIADRLELVDLRTGRSVQIVQKLFRLFAEYHFVIDGQTVAIFKMKFKVFGTKFNITTANGDSYVTKGGVFNYNFSINRGNQMVANISKKLLAFTDSYSVDINAADDDHVLVMAVCIAIDQVVHDRDDGNERSFKMLGNALNNRR